MPPAKPQRPLNSIDTTCDFKHFSIFHPRLAANDSKDPAKDGAMTTKAAEPSTTTIKKASILEIDTKHGKLLVKATTTADSKLQDITIDKPGIPPAPAPIKLLQSQSIEELPLPELKPKADPAQLTRDEIEKKLKLDLKARLDEKNRQLAHKRVRVDFSRSSLERNFITPMRAMTDFLLKSSDLESLAKTKRRSPYEQEPPITVYWRKDVEAKAIEIWGSRENLLKECLKREIEKKKHQQSKETRSRAVDSRFK
jgi:hypothetical protein